MLFSNDKKAEALRALALAGFLGTIGGALAAGTPVTADGCTEDECEGGVACAQNIGEQTECDIISSSKCKTVSCNKEAE